MSTTFGWQVRRRSVGKIMISMWLSKYLIIPPLINDGACNTMTANLARETFYFCFFFLSLTLFSRI